MGTIVPHFAPSHEAAKKKKAPPRSGAYEFVSSAVWSHIFRLQTLRPLLYFEFHLLSFIQCLVAVRLNGGEMNENIFA
jgi:hypothetical protein